MKTALSLLGLSLFSACTAGAQEIAPKEPDPVLEELTRPEGGKPKTSEISVVLDDVGIPPVPLEPTQKPAEDSGKAPVEPAPAAPPAPPSQATVPAPADAAPGEPQLVTGKPPQHAELLKTPAEELVEPEKGVAVQVEKLQSGKGPVDPKKVKLLAPFPAKPLSQPPAGWALDASGKAPAFTREIELSPGSRITLSIRPHVLVPVVDGASQFSIEEPGFDGSLGYHQPGTIGTILSTSVNQLDEDSKQLGAAIDRLQQLLVSLPTPPAEPPPAAVPVKDTTPPKKR